MRARVLARAVLLTLVLAACQRQAPPAPAAEPYDASAGADARRIEADVRFLADDLLEGREAGTRGYDLASLSTLMQQFKTKFPEAKTATVLAQPNTSYNVLVQVMDTVREGVPAGVDPKSKGAYVELFPDISIGDAPISVAKK